MFTHILTYGNSNFNEVDSLSNGMDNIGHVSFPDRSKSVSI